MKNLWHEQKIANSQIFKHILDKNLDKFKNLLPSVDMYEMSQNLMEYTITFEAHNIFDYLITQIDVNYIYDELGEVLWKLVISSCFTRIEDILKILPSINNINHININSRTRNTKKN